MFLFPTPAYGAVIITDIASGKMVSIPVWLEMLAVIAASVAGALSARRNKLDLVGAVTLAFLCALGGGLLRDMILQVGSVYMLDQPLALPCSFIPAIIAFLVPNSIFEKGISEKLIFFLDILAVGLYSATGTDKAMVYGFNPIVCVMMGIITGVGGGMLRDTFLGRIPGIFIPGSLYALASMAGSIAYLVLVKYCAVQNIVALTACVLITMALRYASVHYGLKSPGADELTDWLHKRK